MIDDADVPALFAIALACLVRFAAVLPELVRAAAWGVAIGAVGWALGCVARQLALRVVRAASAA
jgi:hypothetical protein